MLRYMYVITSIIEESTIRKYAFSEMSQISFAHIFNADKKCVFT